MRLSPLQAKALRLAERSQPGTVRVGRDVHAATADALIARGLAIAHAEGRTRILDITAAGRREIQPLEPDR